MGKIQILKTRIQDHLTDTKREFYLLFIGVIGLLAGLLLTLPAWSTTRTYPLTPLFSGLTLSPHIQTILFIICVTALLGSFFIATLRRQLIGITLLSLSVLVILDITRLQPWILHYGAILLLFSFFVKRKYLSNPLLLDTAAIIVGGIYFWSGIQKFNIRFFSEVFPWFTEKIWLPFGETGALLAVSFGLFVPFIEALFAVGFFTKRYRNISLMGATAMIIIVLTCLGPWGHDWNSSVWPWNFAIYGMALLLFFGRQTTLPEFIRRQRHNLFAWFAFVLFWIMPLGNIFGVTDHYLSWSLYSGHVPEATVTGDQVILSALSPQADDGSLRFIHWTQTDLNMVPYPEERVFKSVFSMLCQDPIYKDLTLTITSPQWLMSHKHQTINLECADM